MAEDLRAAWRRVKYRNEPTVVDKVRFASKREAKRYAELKLLERAADISELELQPKFLLGTDDTPFLIRSKGYPNGRRAVYLADFRYRDRAGEVVIEDEDPAQDGSTLAGALIEEVALAGDGP